MWGQGQRDLRSRTRIVDGVELVGGGELRRWLGQASGSLSTGCSCPPPDCCRNDEVRQSVHPVMWLDRQAIPWLVVDHDVPDGFVVVGKR
ncbi:hypothetical protein EV643_14512 [Kribbella sp. VKM Ac-2527]|uniref:Uncharacterized protein n=1 Tax=Kribbella caucasensis TaxID=2512215 RepID=A0A4V3C5F5_9ACTN|nr:hypothetical protein EV643_14512 [Kribbella sp. VKM Ac-2527]